LGIVVVAVAMWADIATAATDVAVVNAAIATADAAVSTTTFLPVALAETAFVAARVSAPRYAEDSAVAAAGVRVEVAVVVPAITPSTRNRHCSVRCPRCSTATEVAHVFGVVVTWRRPSPPPVLLESMV
jgi:hypothetical protein